MRDGQEAGFELRGRKVKPLFQTCLEESPEQRGVAGDGRVIVVHAFVAEEHRHHRADAVDAEG